MAEDPKLVAEARPRLGSAECRRLRLQQRVPGVVYGHGEEPAAIAVSGDALAPIVFSGHKVVDLDLGGAVQKAILRDVQWDTFGTHLVHFDLQRVSADELITTEIAVETHGTAPGVLAGGILDIPLHTIRVECPAVEIPDRIVVNVNHLDIEQAILVRDLKLPEKVRVLNDEDEVVLHIIRPSVLPDEEEGAALGAEPDLVKKAEGDQAAG
jgi:large subunit ribosomal protein L25